MAVRSSAIRVRNFLIASGLVALVGCQTPQPPFADGRSASLTTVPAAVRTVQAHAGPAAPIQTASYVPTATVPRRFPESYAGANLLAADEQAGLSESLVDLENLAVANNPTLRRMQQEAAAERSRAGYADKLPDPTVSSMFFGDAMDFVPDRQLAEIQVMQMIPWLSRLSAEAQRAQLEALAAENLYHAERLRVIGDLRAAWYRLYVLNQQIRTAEADLAQIDSLMKTANARVATGASQPSDVLMASLELNSVQEQLLSYRQQLIATGAEVNRLVGRASQTPITSPARLELEMPQWDHALLKQIAEEAQPELTAARLRSAASRCGIEIARLRRRPDLSFGAGWMVMAADPGMSMPGAGDDAWTLNFSASVPLWHQKYGAMVSEASQRYHAAAATEAEIAVRLDAALQDLWEQALASFRTVRLYESSILPQARQVFEADQQSLVNNTIEFDRVVRDYRTLINLELGYHRTLGQFATTLARIRQTVGVDLRSTPGVVQ